MGPLARECSSSLRSPRALPCRFEANTAVVEVGTFQVYRIQGGATDSSHHDGKPMTDVTIECPHCHKPFKLNETLAAPMVEQMRSTLAKEYELQSQQRIENALAARDAQLAALRQTVEENDAKLVEAQAAHAAALRKQRDLDDKIREIDLNVEKRATELMSPRLEQMKRSADESAAMRLAEKDKTISDLQTRLQDAIHRAEQGSQQLQGEVQELDLERRLREAFVRDTIEPVPKGQFGGDTVHRVLGAQGQPCGTILWESKRTKNWSTAWPDKLKQDQRTAKADLAVIVTQAMPSGIDTFGEVDGVWVCTPSLAIPLAAALRLALTEASLARRATEGQQDKMAVLYQYLTGPQFRQRVEALKDAFTTMQQDLDTERRVIMKQWEKRAKQIERVMSSTVGMYGELQAIAGSTLQQIEGLEMKALEPQPLASEEPK